MESFAGKVFVGLCLVWFLARGGWALSLGLEGTMFFPQTGLPSLEVELAQQVGMGHGFFAEVRGWYYRLVGIGYGERGSLFGMFSGDLVGVGGGLGWQADWKYVSTRVVGVGALATLFATEVREQSAREYIFAKKGENALIVTGALSQFVLPGWGVEGEVMYHWRLFRVGVMLGWLSFEAPAGCDLSWSVLEGNLVLHSFQFHEKVIVEGMRVGLVFRVVL